VSSLGNIVGKEATGEACCEIVQGMLSRRRAADQESLAGGCSGRTSEVSYASTFGQTGGSKYATGGGLATFESSSAP
jgi:hypothetical protein